MRASYSSDEDSLEASGVVRFESRVEKLVYVCDCTHQGKNELVNDRRDNQPLWLGGGALHHTHTLNAVGEPLSFLV